MEAARNHGITAVFGGVVVGFLTLGAGALTMAAETAWQPPDSIRAAARDFVLSRFGGRDAVTVDAVAVDDRLKLPACDDALSTTPVRALSHGQGTVAVSCAGPQPWRIFVPVRISEQVTVVMAARAIPAGQVLTTADLETGARSSSTLPYEYFADPGQALGLRARRTIPAGAIVAPGALSAPPALVDRGAQVTLLSGAGPISVKSDGVALDAGRRNDRVRVRSRSGRIVQGVVEASGAVRVGPLGRQGQGNP